MLDTLDFRGSENWAQLNIFLRVQPCFCYFGQLEPLLGKFLEREYHKSIPFPVARSQFNIANPSNVKICIIFHYFFQMLEKIY